jgi:hypothetical protein
MAVIGDSQFLGQCLVMICADINVRLDCSYRIRLIQHYGIECANMGSMGSLGRPTAVYCNAHSIGHFQKRIADWITKGVQHKFDVKLENLRSALREKEVEIGTLRNTVLSGSVSRQTLLDKRRFEAVEKIWTTVNDSAQLRALYAMTADLNYNVIAKRTKDPKIQQFLSMIDTTGPDPESLKNIARDERPFVPEITWAYFSAFTTLLTFNLARFKTLKFGLEEPQKLLNTERIKNILKAALPHQTQFIDEAQDSGAYYYLLDQIEAKLLNELRKILDGKEADQSSIQQAKNIMNATKAALTGKADDL